MTNSKMSKKSVRKFGEAAERIVFLSWNISQIFLNDSSNTNVIYFVEVDFDSLLLEQDPNDNFHQKHLMPMSYETSQKNVLFQ